MATITDSPSDSVSLAAFVNAYELIQQLSNTELDGVTSARIVRLIRWGQAKYQDYIARRAPFLEQYGTKKEDGNSWTFSKENVEAFNEAMKPIASEQVTVDATRKIPIDSLSSVKISPIAIAVLEPFLAGL